MGRGEGEGVLDSITHGPHCQTPMGFPQPSSVLGITHSPLQTTSGPFSLSCRLLHQKCLRFNPDATIWTAKQQVLCALSESLQDVLNYGLFQPATSGRDANFLEEERLLREYPQSFEKGVPYLEVRPPTAFPAPSQIRAGVCPLPVFSPSPALSKGKPRGHFWL